MPSSTISTLNRPHSGCRASPGQGGVSSALMQMMDERWILSNSSGGNAFLLRPGIQPRKIQNNRRPNITRQPNRLGSSCTVSNRVCSLVFISMSAGFVRGR